MPHQYVSSYTPPERVVLVGIITQNQPEEKLKEYLDELTFLADTAGMQVMHRFTQKLERPDNRFFIGSGKLAQIAAYVKEKEIQGIINVFVVGEGGLLQQRQIKVDKEIGNDLLIKEGLQEGDLVVVSSINRLKTGMQITPEIID